MLDVGKSRRTPDLYTVLLMLLLTRELCKTERTPGNSIKFPTISPDGASPSSAEGIICIRACRWPQPLRRRLGVNQQPPWPRATALLLSWLLVLQLACKVALHQGRPVT